MIVDPDTKKPTRIRMRVEDQVERDGRQKTVRTRVRCAPVRTSG